MSVRILTQVFADSPATGNARLVLLAIADEASDAGLSPFVSFATIATKARVDRKTAMRAVAALEAAGELYVQRPEVRARGRANRYVVALGRPLAELAAVADWLGTEAHDTAEVNGPSLTPLADGTAAVPQWSHDPPVMVPPGGTAPVSSPVVHEVSSSSTHVGGSRLGEEEELLDQAKSLIAQRRLAATPSSVNNPAAWMRATARGLEGEAAYGLARARLPEDWPSWTVELLADWLDPAAGAAPDPLDAQARAARAIHARHDDPCPDCRGNGIDDEGTFCRCHPAAAALG